SGLNAKLNTSLKQSIEVRWDSTLEMVQSVNKNIASIKTLECNDKQRKEIENYLQQINESLLKKIEEILSPFKLIRQTLCEEKSPTFHLVLPSKYKLIEQCSSSLRDDLIIRTFKEKLCKNISHYFIISDYHICASFLTPRFKSLT
ncbi:uncharacterized protein B4U80_14669, partial [Leptotrombidium deliense]